MKGVKKQIFKSKQKKKSAKGATGCRIWEKVKIAGPVISCDGAGLEGLIGLEVLENYDGKIVQKSKRKPILDLNEGKKEAQKRRKRSDESDEDFDGNGSDVDIPKRKSRKSEEKNQKGKSKIKKQLKEKSNVDPSKKNSHRVPSERLGEKTVLSNTTVDDLEGWSGLGVPEPILKAIAENGFQSPTEIQAKTLPAAILGKKDILGAAETGSGKTLAFGIPILTGILEMKSQNKTSGIRKVTSKEINEDDQLPIYYAGNNTEEEEGGETRPLYAVVLTPTRELAVQVKNHIVAAAKYTGIRVASIFGGLSVAKQERVLSQCPEIVVATPGRLWELYKQENPHLLKIHDISFLVIDETDRMVEKGHFEELHLLMNVLNASEAKKKSRQNFIFSATLTLVHDLPEHLRKRNTGKKLKFVKQTPGLKVQSLIEELGISQPKVVDITTSQQTVQTLTESRLMCTLEQKDYYLYYFVRRHPGRTIVFCNSIDCVKRLTTLFGLLRCNPHPLHANMIQKQRLKNLERFRDDTESLLIATDVAARGLDIPNVDHVIHYQVPRTSENYVHRSGRTARANKDGVTVMFIEPSEMKSYLKLCQTLDRTEDLPLFPVAESYMAAIKERVELAREMDRQELKVRRKQSEIGWMKKHADEMELIIDGFNDHSGSEEDEDPFIIERRRDQIHLNTVRNQLKSLLAKEIFPRGFSLKYPTSTGQFQMPTIATTQCSGAEGGNSAVDVVKAAVENMKIAKKMRNKKRNRKS